LKTSNSFQFLCLEALDWQASINKLGKMAVDRQTRADPGRAIAPSKTYESNFIHYDFVQFGKQP